MKALIITAVTLAAIGAAPSARAELVQPALAIDTPDRVTLGVGLEHGLLTELAYHHALDVADVRLTFVARLELPASPDPTDGGVAAGAAAHLVGDDGWGAGLRLLTTVRWAQGSLLDVTQLGAVVGIDGGYYRPGGSVAVELAWDGSLLTHVAPTGRYRRLIYTAGAETFGRGGGVFRLGLAGSVSLGDVVDVGLRAGVVTTEELGAVPGFPLFATLAVGARW